MDWFKEEYKEERPLFEKTNSTKFFNSEGSRPWEGRPESRVAAFLKQLREGTLTTNECLGVSTHRFACDIHTLRKRGFEISTTRINKSQCQYELIGYTPLIPVKKGEQDAYYLSSHWRKKRWERLEIDQHKCTQCRSRENLHCHHWKYNLFAEDAVLELQTYCENCHVNLHHLGSVKIAFPKSVTVDISEQLENLTGANR
tara:strand:+ start:39 stop:638 length:600 start_codon:yes stop_codon:yes gene_type:complete